jgi:hypothetical protein
MELVGKIITKKTPNMQNYVLVSIGTNRDGELFTSFLGDKKSFRFQYSESFYTHIFQADDRKEYYVLSKEDLAPGRYKLCGMQIHVEENTKLGNTAKASTTIPLFFSVEVHPELRVLDKEIFFKEVAGFDHEILAETLFGKLRHPLIFEKFIFSFIMSGKVDGYPMHFLWIAEPGTGKTCTAEAMSRVFGELKSGGSSTFKALIPAFGATEIQPGFFLQSNRYAIIDEFFTMINRGTSAEVGQMTPLLDHSDTIAQSGKHGQYRVHATAKLFCLTNPKWPFNTVDTIIGNAAKLDKAFLSRLTIYFQPKVHVEFLQSRRSAVRASGLAAMPTFNPKIISLIDFLNSFIVPFKSEDVDWAMNLKHKYSNEIPAGANDVYYPRYDHHILCILDGITKYNTIVEGRTDFEVTPKDMSDAEDIFTFIISTWNTETSPLFAPYNVRKLILPVPAQMIAEIVEKSTVPISLKLIEEQLKGPATHWMQVLVKNNIVSEISNGNEKLYIKYSEITFKSEEHEQPQTIFLKTEKIDEVT